MSLPPATLYALLCWANRIPPEPAATQRATGIDAADTPLDLLATWLCREVDVIARRGLQQRYAEHREDLRWPRGQPDFAAAATSLAHLRGELTCVFDELTTDTPANRLLRAALLVVARQELGAHARVLVRRALHRLPAWPEIKLTPEALAAIRLTRSTPYYERALYVARLIATRCTPTPDGSGAALSAWELDSRAMGHVFQDAMHHLIAHRAPSWQVGAGYRHRFVGTEHPLVPVMETDLELTDRADRASRWTIECKCTAHPYAVWYSRKLRSEHLYQVLAYLNNARARGRPSRGGVLLYGSTERVTPLEVTLDGHALRVHGVDLSGPWQGVEASIDALLADLASASPAARASATGS